jgi:hypothetical protein
LIALAMVVYMDETGWKINANNCYTWIFTTLLHTVLLYGESREEPLQKDQSDFAASCKMIWLAYAEK